MENTKKEGTKTTLDYIHKAKDATKGFTNKIIERTGTEDQLEK